MVVYHGTFSWFRSQIWNLDVVKKESWWISYIRPLNIWPLSTLIELKNSLSIFQMSFFVLAVVLLISTSYVSSVFDLHTECNTWAFEDNQCIENPKYVRNHIIIRTFESTFYFLTNQQLYVDFLPHELHKLREQYC